MRSSSTEPGPRFLPVGAGAWARLGLVAALGVGAVLAPGVGTTGAIYTDQERVAFDIQGPPPATADPTATATATADPTPTATADPTPTPTATVAPM